MLFEFIMGSRGFSSSVTVNGIEYKKSNSLKRLDNMLTIIKIIVSGSLVIIAYLLVKNGMIDFGKAGNNAFIIIQSVTGQIVMIPVYFIVLPKPLSNHLEEIVIEDRQKNH